MTFSPGVNKFPDVDAIYIKLRNTDYAGGKHIDDHHNIDLDADGNMIGVTFLNVTTRGADLTGLPEADVPNVRSLLEEEKIRILEPAL